MKTTLVIFGITGNLSRLKLLPALRSIIERNTAGELEVIGVSRQSLNIEQLLMESLGDATLRPYFSAHTMDVAEKNEYAALKDMLPAGGPIVIYLAVPPSSATQIVDYLGESGINSPNVKILFEKPFGYDLISAQDFITRTAQHFDEEQIYRIDHYMAKEVALEIIKLRSDVYHDYHNWNNTTISRVEITALETIGVEGRANFYEQVGALRDVVQGHLMQLLSLVLMRLPDDFSLLQLPQLRYEALKQVQVVPDAMHRGQYKGYDTEVENPGSHTETFVHLELKSSDSKWKGVKLSLTTGKALNKKQTVVRITMKDGALVEFDEDTLLRSADAVTDAYERVFTEAIESRHNIFTSSDEVLESWRILAPIQEQWQMADETPALYLPGSDIADIINV